MSITSASGRTIVDFRANQVHGARSISGYLLKLSIHYEVPKQKEDLLLVNNISAKVLFGKDKEYVDHAFPEASIVFKPGNSPQKGDVLFEILLSSQQLEEIERRRSGGDILLTLSILAEWRDEYNRMHCSDDVTFNINQKEWIDALHQMNYGDFLLYELPLNIEEDTSLQAAFTAFTSAKEHLYYGNYDDVVAKCRIALESILSTVEDLNEMRQLAKGKKKYMVKHHRMMHVIDAIHHYTHLAHHLDSNGSIVSYSRTEAVFALGVTAAAISGFGERS